MHGSRGSYDDLQALFLMRLVRITKLRAQRHGRLLDPEVRRRLIETAFRSTLADCEALGVEAEAHALLETE